MICKLCGTAHAGWDIGACRKARAITNNNPVNTQLTQSVNTSVPIGVNKLPSVNTDRHKPGYMAAYMRKRRASV